MAIAFVSRCSGPATSGIASTSVTSVVTNTQTHAAGNLLVAGISHQNDGTITVTDLGGNTWTRAGTRVNSGGNQLDIFYAYNITEFVANVVTATFQNSAAYSIIEVREFSGVMTTDPIDGAAQATGLNGTSLSSGSVTVSASSDVIFAFMVSIGTNLVAGTGYTLNVNVSTYFASEYHIVTASESATATSSAGDWGITAAAFKVAAAAGGVTYPQLERGIRGLNRGIAVGMN